MSTFSTFGEFKTLGAEYSPQVRMVRVASKSADLVFFLDSQQAIQLRDDLSRAITEAAMAAAKAVEVVA
jgi:hypothetical protein